MTTYLEILNHCMKTVGERPVSSPDSNHPTAIQARVEIDRLIKEVQTRGWWFNKEYNVPLSPNGSDQIIIPQDTLKVTPMSPYRHLVRRDGKLYDPVEHTYAIGESVSVDLVLLLEVDDLPETAAYFIMHSAAYDFYVADDGDEQKANRLERAMVKAWQALQAENLKESRVNSGNRITSRRLSARLQRGSSLNPNLPGGGE